MVDDPKPAAPAFTATQKLLAALFLATIVLPLFPVASMPHLFSPVDRRFLWLLVAAGVVFSQAVCWIVISPDPWTYETAPAKIPVAMFSVLFSAAVGGIFALRAAPLYSFYELQHLDHEKRTRLYVVVSVSTAGRGGPHAFVNPYGFGRWGLPISRADYDGFIYTRISPGLVCYRVAEVRRGKVVGILRTPDWHAPDGLLVACDTRDPRVVMNITKPPGD